MEFCLVNGEAATFLLEEECYSGVAKIAEKYAGMWNWLRESDR